MTDGIKAAPLTGRRIALLPGLDLRGQHVGVQLYPEAPSCLTDFLQVAGALPDPVTPYAYTATAPDDALTGLIERRSLPARSTRSPSPAPHRPMRRTAVAAVGPIVASELERYGANPTIVPAGQYVMKPLVTAITVRLGEQL